MNVLTPVPRDNDFYQEVIAEQVAAWLTRKGEGKPHFGLWIAHLSPKGQLTAHDILGRALQLLPNVMEDHCYGEEGQYLSYYTAYNPANIADVLQYHAGQYPITRAQACAAGLWITSEWIDCGDALQACAQCGALSATHSGSDGHAYCDPCKLRLIAAGLAREGGFNDVACAGDEEKQEKQEQQEEFPEL